MDFKTRDVINVLETNIDDCTGETLGYVMDRLFKAGARDVFYTPIYMKKNRPAYKLTVLCTDDMTEEAENIIFSETTSIGLRKRKEERVCLKREIKEIETKYGKLKVKSVLSPIGEKIYPDFESAKELAEKNHTALNEIYKEIK